jgi:hypothetical protein
MAEIRLRLDLGQPAGEPPVGWLCPGPQGPAPQNSDCGQASEQDGPGRRLGDGQKAVERGIDPALNGSPSSVIEKM